MLNVYIGWDPREITAYSVAEYSIQRRTKSSVNIAPLKLNSPEIQSILTRPVERRAGKLYCPISEANMSTEFAISRFCVPFLQDSGWAMFCDCDVICLADIKQLFDLADERYAVQVVKHRQESGDGKKMDGQVQSYYSRKNWSSVVLWNLSHPAHKRLTLKELNNWPGRDLHGFRWLEDEEIGELPLEWNYLADVSHVDTVPKLVHYTLGTPNMPGYEMCQYSAEWWAEYQSLGRVN